ncbi:DHA2 family efflux MFS transporter permease subunit [Thauera humireducens]|uniref:MFS transporter n=1 Tax=Thauera humireducens TaxID=1134435 RepID=A0A127K4Z4_9RHOO|nr:DHA2 family efflux MFS transporter permease subunit [Thauera humireducens]AMO37029.1 MFS transporter [Thauera humireducens]
MRCLPPVRTRDELIARHGEAFKWLALTVVGLGTIAAVLATTSFNVAVPALGAYYGLGQHQVQWAITGFMAALTVAMLPTPWLLDRIGFRRLFLGANLLLGVSSVAGALGDSFSFVVAMRTVQGVAAGLLQPLPMLAVMRLFSPGSQGRAHGLLGFGIVLAPAVAPALAGVLLDRFGWPSIFLMSLPFCVIAGILGLYLLPRHEAARRQPFDWQGVGILCAASLLAIDFIASLRGSGLFAPRTSLVLVLSMVCVVAFVRHARRAAAPIVSLDIFAERSFAMAGLVTVVYGFGLYASTYLIPVFLQSALGYDATHAGLALLPSGMLLAVVIPLAGVLTDRYSPRWITVWGLVLFGVSFVLFAWRGGEISYAEVIGFSLVGRLGLGLTVPALMVATMAHVVPARLGQASMVSNYTRQLGGVLGVAVVAVFVEWRTTVHGALADGVFVAYVEAFLLLALSFALAVAFAVRMRPRTASME